MEKQIYDAYVRVRRITRLRSGCCRRHYSTAPEKKLLVISRVTPAQ